MTRHTGARFATATALSLGLLFALTPHGAAATTGTVDADDRAPIAAVGEHLWPVEALSLPSTITVHAAGTPGPTAPATTAPATTAPADHGTPVDHDTDDAAAERTAPAEQPVDVTPEPVPAPAPAPAPTEEAPVPTTGTIHVDVNATADASRTVSVRAADGTSVAGPVAVDGNRITFTGLEDGTYDVLAEQHFDGGGTFVTRTVVDVAGGETVLGCDAETLDCTVS